MKAARGSYLGYMVRIGGTNVRGRVSSGEENSLRAAASVDAATD